MNGVTSDLDEFGERRIQALPVRQKYGRTWSGCGPTYEGELTPCFDGGHLFRIINHAEKKWALYNDTSVFEMHVEFTFGKDSQLSVLGNTQITTNERGEFVVTAVVYPLETVMFISGTWNGYRSHFEGRPLSQAYLERVAESTVTSVERAMKEVAKLTSSRDEEEVLQACISGGVSFVDPAFPPRYISLDAGKGILPALPWCRPEDYLPEDFIQHLALFRTPVTPSSIERGDLSDSWVLSAMAALAEEPECIKSIFRHPSDSTMTEREAAVGAHRALINKDGMWRSYLVDEYLPVVGNRPRFSHNKNDPCEMWVSFLEKAYAKRNGGFANICTGDPLIALRDFTGWPTSRLDAAFREAQKGTEASDSFFTRLLSMCQAGYTILFSTPGNGSENAQMAKYKEAGIAIGYALPVLNVHYANGHGLLRMRNPWGNGVQWKGNWGPSSHLWKENPELAAECTNHDGSDNSLWMNWIDVKDYFIGCGVVFNHPSYYDYRVPGTFNKVVPSVCLEITVKSPLKLSLILSQPDRRGTDREMVDYDPVMLNVASSENNSDQFTVVANTTADAETPSDRYIFLHGRDVSMMYEFIPEYSSYLVIPRRMIYGDDAETVLPFTLGVLSPVPITKDGPVSVSFKVLSGSNEVFENYPQFTNDGETVSLTYQRKDPNSHLVTTTTSQIT